MGNEQSSPVDEDTPTETLSARSIEAVAKFIKDGQARNIVVMTGAGISTSAGIPDFRSPDTGLYANLARLNLPYAEAVFDINYFRTSPEPFYTLAHELYPGKYRPTITHSFIRLLHDKGLLLKLFTQNIDCLERTAGVPDDKIIEAHGSFARQSCIECQSPFPRPEMEAHIAKRSIPRCATCHGLVKPEIVFFGEQLPANFFRARMLPQQADLCIVLGTSLTVQPFASLPDAVRSGVPRVLINRERVGTLGSRADDVLVLDNCDGGVRRLATACGWGNELEALWAETVSEDYVRAEEWSPSETAQTTVGIVGKTSDEKLEEEVDKLTREVDATLKLSKSHTDKVLDESRAPDTRSQHVEPRAVPTPPAPTTQPSESPSGRLDHVFVGASFRGDDPVPGGEDSTQVTAAVETTTSGDDGSKL